MTPISQDILTDILILFMNVYFYHNSDKNWAKSVYMTCGIMITIMLVQDIFRMENLQ